MEKDDDKRILDGPITSSMRPDHPSPQSIGNLRERYAIHEKMTTDKPVVSFDTVLEGVARDGRSVSEATEKGEGDEQQLPSSSVAEAAGDADVFERVPSERLRQSPLPTGRHPDTPVPGGKGKVIIKA